MLEKNNLMEHTHRLERILEKMGSILLAFSGGVDSTLLLKVARDVVGNKVIAVTAVSPIHPQEEYDNACAIARSLGVRHILIETHELKNPRFRKNPSDRCYYCKKELFPILKGCARKEGINVVIDGSNLDDLADFRPGMIAAKEEQIRSPLLEAGLTKGNIRTLSRKMGLPTWNEPSMACLASRFPYGESISLKKIKQVDQAERFLRERGFKQLRVRSHNKLARIEVDANQVHKLTDSRIREKVFKKLKGLGFIYITIDLEGYRTGSMNEVLG